MRLWPTLSVRRETGSMQISIYMWYFETHLEQPESFHSSLGVEIGVDHFLLGTLTLAEKFSVSTSDNGNTFVELLENPASPIFRFYQEVCQVCCRFCSQSTPMLLSGVGPHLICAFVGSHSSLDEFLRWTIYSWTAKKNHFWCWTNILTSSRFDFCGMKKRSWWSPENSSWMCLSFFKVATIGLPIHILWINIQHSLYLYIWFYMFILSPGNLGGGRQGTGGPFEPSGIRAPRHDQKPVGNPGVFGFPGPLTIWKCGLLWIVCIHGGLPSGYLT